MLACTLAGLLLLPGEPAAAAAAAGIPWVGGLEEATAAAAAAAARLGRASPCASDSLPVQERRSGGVL